MIFEKIVNVIRLGVAILRHFKKTVEPGPMSDAELQELLEGAAARVPDAPDWKNSIVDLLKILRQPSDISDRAVLWNEMGAGGVYNGTAEQNQTLHSIVIKRLAERKIQP